MNDNSNAGGSPFGGNSGNPFGARPGQDGTPGQGGPQGPGGSPFGGQGQGGSPFGGQPGQGGSPFGAGGPGANPSQGGGQSGAFGGGQGSTPFGGQQGAPGQFGGQQAPGGFGGPQGGPGQPGQPGQFGYPAPGGAPGSSPQGGGGGKKGLLIGAIALVALLVAGVLAFVLTRGGDEEKTDQAASTSATSAPAAASGASGASGSSSAAPSSAASSAPSSSARAGGSDSSDGSLGEPYAAAVPAAFKDMTRNCRQGTVTISSYGGGDTQKREAPGVMCMGVKGTPTESKNIEFVDDDEWSKHAIEKAKGMDHEVIKEEGGKFVAVTTFTSGSSTIYYSDTNAGVELEIYPFETKDEARGLAQTLAG